MTDTVVAIAALRAAWNGKPTIDNVGRSVMQQRARPAPACARTARDGSS
jgi:hypothetical protein